MFLVLMMGCGSSTVEDDDDGGGIILSDPGAPTMADCTEWLAESQADSIPHACSTEEYRSTLIATGGAVYPVGDGRYYTAWFPPDWDGQTVIYAVHGSSGCADMMSDLFAQTSQGAYAVLSLQYRTAGDVDYDSAETLYDNLTDLHEAVAVRCPIDTATGVYYGYSRGGGRAYEIGGIDAAGSDLFEAILIDSGTNALSQLTSNVFTAMSTKARETESLQRSEKTL